MKTKATSQTSRDSINLHKRLNANKASTAVFASRYLTSSRLSKEKIKKQLLKSSRNIIASSATLSENPEESKRKDIYANLLEDIETIKDNRRNIFRFISSTKHPDGSSDMLRDARMVSAQPNRHSPESYAMQCINLARATEILIDEAKKINPSASCTEIRKRIRSRVGAITNSILAHDPNLEIDADITIEFTNKLISFLGDLRDANNKKIFENPAEALNDAKEIVSFDSNHYHISTITQTSKGVVVESDVMALGCTDEIKQEFKNILNNRTEGIVWFNRMREPLKTLVRRYAQKFIDGNHLTPTQLSNIVGIRNAYLKSTMVKRDIDERFVPLLESMHCGAPVFLGVGSARETSRLTKMAMQQYGQLLTDDGNVEQIAFCSLNSSMGEPADQKIVKYVKKVSQLLRTTFFILPLNIFRHISRSNSHAIEPGIADIAKLAKKAGYRDIAEFLVKGETRKLKYLFLWKGSERFQLAREQLKKVEPRSLRNSLKQVMEVKNLLIHGGRKRNLEIAGYIPNIETSAKKGSLFELAEKHRYKLTQLHQSIIFCKSGKDRTGLVELYSSAIAVADALEIPHSKIPQLFKTMSSAAHAQAIAGRQGGTFGCHGLKGSTKSAMQARFSHSADILFLPTADLNRIKKRKPHKSVGKKLKLIQQIKLEETNRQKPSKAGAHKRRARRVCCAKDRWAYKR